MIKAILFDLDGTLCDTLADLAAATNYTLRQAGFPEHALADYRYFVGNGIPKLIERALPEEHRSAEQIAACKKVFLSYYGQHFSDLTVAYDGMPELLEQLKNDGFRLAVCTNKAQANAETVVKTFYGDVFDRILGQQDALPTKPDPAMPRLIMEQLGVTPQECVFVGDSSVDMQTAVRCGALPVGVLWGFRDREELEQNGAAAIATDPVALRNIIREAK